MASKKKLQGCNFSYSTFDAAYLRDCVFDSCNFTGTKFTDSNLRGSKFVGCKFDYARFLAKTFIDPSILDSGCPGPENLKQIFARSLRVNFDQIGDREAVNRAIGIELEATRNHLLKSWRSRESYYRKKYSGTDRASCFVKWLRFELRDLIFGNGESVYKLCRTLLAFAIIVALGDVLFLRDVSMLSSYIIAFRQTPGILAGVTVPDEYSGMVMAIIIAVRYVIVAWIISIMIKRMSWR